LTHKHKRRKFVAGEENREKALEMAVSQIEKRFWICPKGMTFKF
jgi:hypothetical protein